MKVFSFVIILIVSIILSSKTESEACIWRNWFCDWITGRNNDKETTTTPSTGKSITEPVVAHKKTTRTLSTVSSTTELVVTTNEPPTPAIHVKIQVMNKISSSIDQFSSDVRKDMNEKINGSFIVSPLSAAMVLMMSGYGASDENANKMNSMLHFDTNDNTYKEDIYSLIEIFDALNQSQFELANRIYAGKNQDLNPDFKSLVSETFKSSIENVDFGLSESTAKKIDDWRAEKNHHRLRNVIKPDEINADTELLFINSVYFSRLWKEPFNKANTKLVKFDMGNGETIEKPIMDRKMEFTVHSTVTYKLCTLDFKSDSDDDSLQFVMRMSGDSITKSITVPKFRIESTINLEDMLNLLGMNFSGISKQASGLKINKVVQKLTLEVNESGIEAAIRSEASFANKTGSNGPPLKQVLIFNEYPFDFHISYNGVVLLVGHVAKQ
ncbi:serpin B6-like [Microplitis mediator]|uniref:serpin B6-like n=1 Tax=Microplitis mediator TaxID=375433 RepID=UPI002555B354|nr:serpin B6-like [Microplitis mediator]